MEGIPFGKGICYSGFRAGQSPRTGVYPSDIQVAEDLQLLVLEGYQYIRMYEPNQHAEMVLKQIRRYGLPLKVVVGIDPKAEQNNPECPWVGAELDDEQLHENSKWNDEQIERLIHLAGTYRKEMIAVSIGNENTPNWGSDLLSEQRLIQLAKRLKTYCAQPVTYNEGAPQWMELKNLAVHLDFLSIHSYPQWNRIPIEDAFAYTVTDYEKIQNIFPEKQVVIGEYGWTTASCSGQMRVEEATKQNQAEYRRQMENWLAERGITGFLFEAFDEPWKGGADLLEPEKHWGIFTEGRRKKEGSYGS